MIKPYLLATMVLVLTASLFSFARQDGQEAPRGATTLASMNVVPAQAAAPHGTASDEQAPSARALAWSGGWIASLSSGDCKGIASGDRSWCDTDDCKGIASKDRSWCDSNDCKGVASGDRSWCESSLCKGWASGDRTWCDSNDCKGVASKDRSWCDSGQCKAIASGDRSWCP